MNTFNPGDKVVEIRTGDEGTVLTSPDWLEVDRVYVQWTTGDFAGCGAHININEIKLFSDSENTSVQDALNVLLAAGYKVTLER